MFFTKRRLGEGLLPDWTVPAVGVPGCYSPHFGANRSVLVHIHNVIVHRENWGLIHIPYSDFKGGGVFERARVGKTGVQFCIRRLNVKSVSLLPLVVQWLYMGKGASKG